jgi:hypothetical protein
MEHVSATSIKLFQNCQRRWYERYILGKKEESTKAMARGNAVHRQLEEYLEKGVLPDESIAGQIANAGLAHLPTPCKDHQVEQSLDDYRVPNVAIKFKGFIDLLLFADGELEVLDHKTTSNFKYALTEEQLSEDTQMLIYARHVLEHHDVDEVTLTHVVYLTKPPYQSKRTSARVSKEHVYSKFEEIHHVVEQMLESSQKQINEMGQNRSFCFSYGRRCPYYNSCNQRKIDTETLGVIKKLRGEELQLDDVISQLKAKEPTIEEVLKRLK